MKRITPLNIVTSILLIWLGFGIIDKTVVLSQLIWGLVILAICIIGDQMVRVAIKDLKRIWLVQMSFIVITFIAAFAIWYIKN